MTYGPTLPLSDKIHKEHMRGDGETFRDAMARIAGGMAEDDEHFHKIFKILLEMRFCPGGRVQAAVGSTRVVTPFNCFVSGTIDDSIEGIYDKAKEAALIMKMGGGVGFDFSSIRWRGAPIESQGTKSSGAVSFMGIYNAGSETIRSAGNRRGAMMAVLRIDHPDIEEFIAAKTVPGVLTNFNLSVAVTDEFMLALKAGAMFHLKFDGKVIRRVNARALWDKMMRANWDWGEPGVLFIDTINKMNNLAYCEQIRATNPCVHGDTLVSTALGEIPIKDLTKYSSIQVYTYNLAGDIVIRDGRFFKTKENAEIVAVSTTHGIVRCTPDHRFMTNNGWIKAIDLKENINVFIVGTIYDRAVVINATVLKIISIGNADVFDGNVDHYHNYIADGHVVHNCAEEPLPPYGCCFLGSFNLVKYLKDKEGSLVFDYAAFSEDIRAVVRGMDNIIDDAHYPLEEHMQAERNTRRMGLGIMGAANAIEMMGYQYGTKGFVRILTQILSTLVESSYTASNHLAIEKGSFPLFDSDLYCHSPFINKLPPSLVNSIRKHGIRNSHLISIAPTGTIALCADNVSSGIEPVYNHQYERTILDDGVEKQFDVVDYAYAKGVTCKTMAECSVDDHLRVLAAATRWSDSAVSKTVNVGDNVLWEDFKLLYERAWMMGCKGLTTFRSSGKRAGILKSKSCKIDPKTGNKTCDM